MIYFDNAATSGFRPHASIAAAENAAKYISANPGRSSHKLSILGEGFIYKTRRFLSKSFNNEAIDRVIFTKNCTESLNTAIFGLFEYCVFSRFKKSLSQKLDELEIVTTLTEHNSVLRPLYRLNELYGITIKFASPKKGFIVKPQDVLSIITDKTVLVVINAASNVTGQLFDYSAVGNALKGTGIPFVLDFAQGAGHFNLDMKKSGVNALCFAGHKGFYSVAGSGGLIFDKNFDVLPTFFGGSGTETFLKKPTSYPELLEAGTLNLPSICSLYEGAKFAFSDLDFSAKRLKEYTKHIIRQLSGFSKIKLYSEPNSVGIVAFAIKGLASEEAAEIYSENYSIALRGGFHCAPCMHRLLKTEKEGLLRVSLSPFNNLKEIQAFLDATDDILRRLN